MDGVGLGDDVNGGPLFNVTLEGVQEFNVLAHDYPANYGLTSGGVVTDHHEIGRQPIPRLRLRFRPQSGHDRH